MVMPPEAALSLVHVFGKALGIPHFALSTIIGAVNRSAVVLSVWVLVALGVAVIAVVAIKHACLDIALLITLTIVVQLRRASLCTFGRHVRTRWRRKDEIADSAVKACRRRVLRTGRVVTCLARRVITGVQPNAFAHDHDGSGVRAAVA
eukprot:scaffold15742_cov71-Phaeocystis_antarctica.AAC.4